MRYEKKKRGAFEEHSFWQSYSDMMAALLLIFILLIAITLSIYKQKTTDLDNTRHELNIAQDELDAARYELEEAMANLANSRLEIELSNQELAQSLAELEEAYNQAALTQEALNNAYLEIENGRQELEATRTELEDIVGIRTDIIGALQDTFQNSSMEVDAQTGSITFSSDVLFRYNSATLTNASKETLKEVIPKYLEVLLQDKFRDSIAEIIIEGHTDTDGTYLHNLRLSFDRANAVATFCLDPQNGLGEIQITQFQKLLTVNGRSFSSPIYIKNVFGISTGEIDAQASRRVEIKFRLKEDEMIDRISEVLKKD